MIAPQTLCLIVDHPRATWTPTQRRFIGRCCTVKGAPATITDEQGCVHVGYPVAIPGEDDEWWARPLVLRPIGPPPTAEQAWRSIGETLIDFARAIEHDRLQTARMIHQLRPRRERSP